MKRPYLIVNKFKMIFIKIFISFRQVNHEKDMSRYRVVINRAACLSCGAAPAACPEVFELGRDNGKNRVVEKYSVKTDDGISIGEIPEELYGCARSGADICPVSAITIEKID